MKKIDDWLADKIGDLGNEAGFANDGAVEQHAEVLRAKAQADGYTADELNDACGGDIAAYLRVNLAADGEGKIAGDLPLLAPFGLKQE